MTKSDNTHRSTETVFDKQTLLKLVGDDEALLKDILQDFPEMAAESLKQLETALHAGDAERVRREAHSMKGMASNISGNQLRNLAGRIEEDAARCELEIAGRRVKQLRDSLKRLVAAMREAGLVE